MRCTLSLDSVSRHTHRKVRGRSVPRRLLVIGLILLTAGPLSAAPPVISSVIPRGWKAGPNEVTVQGANFTETMQLLIDVPGAIVAIKPEPKPLPNQMLYVVTLPADALPGLFEVRAATDEGITVPAMILVDTLPSVAEVEPNNDRAQAQPLSLPAAVEGRLGGAESDWFAFDGKAGQKVVAEIAGRRLGCNMKPVLRLYNADRLELAAARPAHSIGRDARFSVTLPTDGRYFIELHDLLYRGDNNQYRLLIGDLDSGGSLFPLGGKRSSTIPVQVTGGTLAAPQTLPVALPGDSAAQYLGVTAPAAGALASPFPLTLAVSDREEIVEQPMTAGADGKPTPQAVPLGAVVNGRIARPGEEDRYLIPVTPETRVRVSLQSERLGRPLDAVITLRNEQGAVLNTTDDGPGTVDPDFLFSVPKDVKSLIVSVSDVNRRGSDAHAYRLWVEPAADGDFELTLLGPLMNVPAGGSASIRVRAVRREFNEPIRLKLTGDVPQGLEIRGAEIGKGTTDTLLSLTAPAGAGLKAGTIQVVGEAGPAEKPTITRVAVIANQPAYDAAPWLKSRVSSAVTKAGIVSMTIDPPEPVAIRGGEYKVKVLVKRSEGQTGPIRLTGLTSQLGVPGIVPCNPIPNLTIAENATEGEFRFQVPVNATDMPMTFVVSGQLLDAKTKNAVVATVETPSFTTRVVFPYAPELTLPQEWKRGVRNIVAGKLVRYGAFNEPVTLQLTGLPANFRTLATVSVPADATEFSIPVLIPPGQPPGPLPNVRLATNTPMNAMLVNQRQPIDIGATVAATDPPASLEIYSDGDDFVTALVEGGGMATAETTDVGAGQQAVLIKGDKQRTILPGLNVPIAEAPMPGQYRFLRYAWKKKGGQSATFLVGANNTFGGQSQKMTDYRYLAGPLPNGSKSVKVAETAPAEWTVVTRDLFADHGAFNFTGIGFSSGDGEGLLIDHIYLGRTEADLPPLK